MHQGNLDYEKLSNLKIYSSKYNNGNWGNIKELSFNHELYSNGHPTGIPGKSFLIYSNNSTEGQGEADLYLIRKSKDGWSEPQSLGNEINTQGYELFPYLLDDSTLYFASNGHNGLGGLDIFKAKLKNGKASNIQNMGQGFNSPHDDFGLVYTNHLATEGYFSSDRKTSIGGSDIYSFHQSYLPIIIEVRGTSVYILKQKNGQLFSSNNSINFTTDDYGI